MAMTEIPMPLVLRPAVLRVVDADQDRTDDEVHLARLADALKKACSYGEQLWRELQATREYLLEQVARGNIGDSGPILDDHGPLLVNELQWLTWTGQYAAVCNALRGPDDDDGFGRREALREAKQHGRLEAD